MRKLIVTTFVTRAGMRRSGSSSCRNQRTLDCNAVR